MWRTSNCRRRAGTGHPRRNALRRSTLAGLLAAAILSALAGRASAQVWNSVVQNAVSTTPLSTACAHAASITINLATGAPQYTCITAANIFNSIGATAGTVALGSSVDGTASCYAPSVNQAASTTAEYVLVGQNLVGPGTHTFNVDAQSSVTATASTTYLNIICVPQR